MDKRLQDQLTKEIKIINVTLKAFRLDAGTKPAWTIVGGDQLVLYGLKTAPGQAISAIETRLAELGEAISACRKSKTLVRLLRYPLRLEVTHPARRPLAWNNDALNAEPHTLLLGRTYDGGARDLRHSFDDAPHVLVAGTTGAGKSVAMLNMLLPLCWNTSSEELRLSLIDMKNTDLVPLRRLPHAGSMATDISRAGQVLSDAVDEMTRRQAKHVSTPRLLIVIDEYADLTSDGDCMRLVGELARKGRSANINLMVATQHPTGKALGDSTIKNNFAARCVGLVADASAASCAAGRPGTHAELLPGKGAFLYVTGLDCIRYQSYLIDDVTSESLITRIGRKWRDVSVMQPVITSYATSYDRLHTSKNEDRAITGYDNQSPNFPLSEGRALTAQEAAAVREMARQEVFMWRGVPSMTSICKAVYGSKDDKRMGWISDALDGAAPEPVADSKIIRLQRAGGGR